MRVYHYHPETQEYLGSAELPRPPANAVKAAPPEAGRKQKAVYNSKTQSWSLKADQRGTKVYDKKTGAEKIWGQLGAIDSKYTTAAVPDDFILGGYSFSEDNNQWQRPELSLDQKKTNLRRRLLGALQSIASDVDNPLLTCILLANISEDELPVTIAKNGLTQTEAISDDETAITKEAEIRSALLSRYKSIVGFAVRLSSVTTQVQLTALETEISEAL